MADVYDTSRTDLTGILPKPCWPFFEDLLDAIYGEGREAPEQRARAQGGQEDGVLTCASAVPLLAAADVLSMRSLFERAVGYLARHMTCRALDFWGACLAFEGPLSQPLERVAAAARTGVLRGFERFLMTSEDSLLQLPHEAMLGLLRENRLAVRAESRLATFLIKYGRVHKLLSPDVLDAADKERGKGLPQTGVDRESRWWELCAAVRWGDINPSMTHPGAFPLELMTLGMAYRTALGSPDYTHSMFMKWPFPPGVVLQPRERVRPPHAPPLLPHQVEKFVYFAPDRWERGHGILADSVDSGLLQFSLRLYPGGDTGFNIPEGSSWAISAFVELLPKPHWPEVWTFKDVKHLIWCVPWVDDEELMFEKSETFTFTSAVSNRGWQLFLTSADVGDRLGDLLSPEGYLLVRASVPPATALRGP